MNKRVLLILLGVLIVSLGYGQSHPTSYKLSGFEVVFVNSETFHVEYDQSIEVERTFENGILSVFIIDQTGRIPKGKIVIHTNKIDSLYLHNCTIEGKIPSSEVFSLEMYSSIGSIDLNGAKVVFNINAASKLSVRGKTDVLICNVGAASSVDAARFVAEEGEVCVVGYSSLIVNMKKYKDKGKGSFKNVYSPN
jgi:hypothetical protein